MAGYQKLDERVPRTISELYRALNGYVKGVEKDGQHSSSLGNVMAITRARHRPTTANGFQGGARLGHYPRNIASRELPG